MVDYAHTPDGLRNALKALRPLTSGALICVFGCGGDRDKGKRAVMASIASSLSDKVIITSDNPRNEDPVQIIDDILKGIPSGVDFLVEIDRRVASDTAILKASPEDIVLIAGKGHENYQIIGSDNIPFDDREQAKKALLRWLK